MSIIDGCEDSPVFCKSLFRELAKKGEIFLPDKYVVGNCFAKSSKFASLLLRITVFQNRTIDIMVRSIIKISIQASLTDELLAGSASELLQTRA